MLTSIGEEAFAGIKAECVIIPENVTVIGPRAFADSPELEKVILESGSVEIAPDAFEGCGDVEIVDMEDAA